jgi:ABC-2 type transport system permease protein
MLALRSASMSFAGTDFAHHRNFARAAEEHRRNFVQLLNEDLMNNAIQSNPGYSAGPELWEKLPVFAPEPIAAHELWRGARRDILVLAGWLAAALGLLTFSATRLRVGGQ